MKIILQHLKQLSDYVVVSAWLNGSGLTPVMPAERKKCAKSTELERTSEEDAAINTIGVAVHVLLCSWSSLVRLSSRSVVSTSTRSTLLQISDDSTEATASECDASTSLCFSAAAVSEAVDVFWSWELISSFKLTTLVAKLFFAGCPRFRTTLYIKTKTKTSGFETDFSQTNNVANNYIYCVFILFLDLQSALCT